MRLSLVTRVSGTYLFLLLLLAGVAGFSVWSLNGMRREVGLLKQGLLPASSRIEQFNQELTRCTLALKKGSHRDLVWLSHYLPEMGVFETLDGLRTSFQILASNSDMQPDVKASFRELEEQLVRLNSGHQFFEILSLTDWKAKEEWAGLSNRELFLRAVEDFADARNRLWSTEPVDSTNPTARRLGVLLQVLRKEGLRIETQLDLASNQGLTLARERGESALTVSVVLAATSLVVILVIFVLLQRWLKPLGELRRYAQRLSLGNYDHPLPRTASDEIGVLAQELSRMAQRLKEREEMIRNQAKELVRSDRFSTIGKMSTQIAHEIRNPLNAMGLKLELLEESVEDLSASLPQAEHDSMKTAIVSITREIDRLREITDYYLKFAKFPKVEKELVDLSMILGDLVAFYREEAERRTIAIETEFQSPLRCQADANLIRHATANLLRNSIEALHGEGTKEGQIVVKCWKAGDKVYITVRDNGPGISVEHLEHIFEPFYSNKKSGTGLGLTLVQQILHEHGGEVRCSSQVGQGATFHMTFPT